MYKTLPIIALVVSVVAVATLIPLTSQAFLGPVWVPFSGGSFSGWGGYGGYSGGCGYGSYYGGYGYAWPYAYGGRHMYKGAKYRSKSY
jgi:hypothetical protein